MDLPCEAGAPARISSDLMGSFSPGGVEVVARASVGTERRTWLGDVELLTFSEARDLLAARVADPNDPAALDDLVASLQFRLRYNPAFADLFYRGILGDP